MAAEDMELYWKFTLPEAIYHSLFDDVPGYFSPVIVEDEKEGLLEYDGKRYITVCEAPYDNKCLVQTGLSSYVVNKALIQEQLSRGIRLRYHPM